MAAVPRPPIVLAGTFLLLFSIAGCSPEPVGQAVEPATGPVLVVANQEQGRATLVEVDTGRIIAHVDPGMHPHEGAASPDGRTVALVSPSTWLGDARTVALIDVATATLARTIDLGWNRWPHGVAFDGDGTLLVSSRRGASVVFIDPTSGRIQQVVDTGGSRPYLLHLSNATGRIYVSNPSSDTITELDAESRTLRRTLRVPDQPAGFAVSPRGDTLWIATWSESRGSAIAVLDVAAGSVTTWITGLTHPRRLTFSEDGSRVYVTDDDQLRVYDTATRSIAGTIHLAEGGGASGVVCAPRTSRCYVALIRAGEVVEVDVNTLTVARRFPVGEGADGLVYVPR